MYFLSIYLKDNVYTIDEINCNDYILEVHIMFLLNFIIIIDHERFNLNLKFRENWKQEKWCKSLQC